MVSRWEWYELSKATTITSPEYVADKAVCRQVVAKRAATRSGQDRHALDTDHSGLSKYQSRDDASYIAVKNQMASMVQSWIGRPKPSPIFGTKAG